MARNQGRRIIRSHPQETVGRKEKMDRKKIYRSIAKSIEMVGMLVNLHGIIKYLKAD